MGCSVVSRAKPREFTAAEVALALKAEVDAGDELSLVPEMLEAFHRMLVKQEARRDTKPSSVPSFGCRKMLESAGLKLKERP